MKTGGWKVANNTGRTIQHDSDQEQRETGLEIEIERFRGESGISGVRPGQDRGSETRQAEPIRPTLAFSLSQSLLCPALPAPLCGRQTSSTLAEKEPRPDRLTRDEREQNGIEDSSSEFTNGMVSQ